MIKRLIIIVILLSIHSICFGITSEDLTDRIIIDGLSDEFTLDEQIMIDSLGNLLESPADSYWGEYNDVKQMKITWDLSYLYLAVDACSWDNNVMLFIDIYNSYGIEDMSELNAWQRSFRFFNFNPDYFIGTWDTNDSPQFWKIKFGGSRDVELISSIETVASFDTGNLNGSMEIKIPWETIYFDSNHSLLQYPTIKLLSLITSGDNLSSSPDCAPDNLGGMINDGGQMVVLDNYVEIIIDNNRDGFPDIGVSPQSRRSFPIKEPPFETMPLEVDMVEFITNKTFSPILDELVSFTLKTNRISNFIVQIFDLNGNYIINAEGDGSLLNWQWDGKNKNGDIVPFGIYILRFVAESGEVSYKETVVVIN